MHNNKKVGILTFSCADNVGAVLQCYALKTYLESKKSDVQVINYCPYYLTDSYGYFHNPFDYIKRHNIYRTLTRIRYEIINYKKNRIKAVGFEDFRKNYLNIQEPRYRTSDDLQHIAGVYDAIVVGSDQIWRNEPTFGTVDKAFLLDFLKNTDTKKFAYAASIGKIESSSDYIFKEELKSFEAVSVRESDAKEYLQKVTDMEIQHVLDPVFLIDKEKYDAIIENSQLNIDKPFIFVYSLENNPAIIEATNQLVYTMQEKDVEVLYYSSTPLKFNCKHRRIHTLLPNDFLYYVKNSIKIVTNSFHGTAFSIIFGKEFYSVLHTLTGNRIKSLLAALNLENRIVEKDLIEPKSDVYIESTIKLLAKEIDNSRKFADKFLN